MKTRIDSDIMMLQHHIKNTKKLNKKRGYSIPFWREPGFNTLENRYRSDASYGYKLLFKTNFPNYRYSIKNRIEFMNKTHDIKKHNKESIDDNRVTSIKKINTTSFGICTIS